MFVAYVESDGCASIVFDATPGDGKLDEGMLNETAATGYWGHMSWFMIPKPPGDWDC